MLILLQEQNSNLEFYVVVYDSSTHILIFKVSSF